MSCIDNRDRTKIEYSGVYFNTISLKQKMSSNVLDTIKIISNFNDDNYPVAQIGEQTTELYCIKPEESFNTTCRYSKERSDFKCVISSDNKSKGFFYCPNHNDNHKGCHIECFVLFTTSFLGGNFIRKKMDDGVERTFIHCCKRCHTKLGNYVPTKKNTFSRWSDSNKDGFSALDALLEWFTDETNAQKFLGHKDHSKKEKKFGGYDGSTKIDTCKVISEFIISKTGIVRTPESVQSKLEELIGNYKKGSDFINQTGQGILADEGEETLEEVVKKKYPFYYQLQPVLMNRPNMSVQYNTDMTEIPKELDLSDEDSVFNIDNSLSTESSSVTKKDNTLLNNSNASIKMAPASAVKKIFIFK